MLWSKQSNYCCTGIYILQWLFNYLSLSYRLYSILWMSGLWHCLIQQNCFNCTLQLPNVDITRGPNVISYGNMGVSWTDINWLVTFSPEDYSSEGFGTIPVGKRFIQWSVNFPIAPLVRKDISNSPKSLWGCFCLLETVRAAVRETVSSTA